jgi:hypothetical protein
MADATERAEVLTMALQRARTRILESHRRHGVRVYLPAAPHIDLEATVRVELARVTAQGKVRQWVDVYGIESGEATTELVIAVSRGGGTGTALIPPAVPAHDVSTHAPSNTLPAFTQIGGRDAAYREDLPGFSAQAQKPAASRPSTSLSALFPPLGRPRTPEEFPTRYLVEFPPIADAIREPATLAAAAAYQVAIPDDDFSLTAG